MRRRLFSLKNQALLLVVSFCMLLEISTTAQTYTFGHVAIGGTGFVDGIITSKKTPNIMFARTDVGGAYRWDSTATKWVAVTDWVSQALSGYLGIESIALDPQNDNNFYMLVGTSYFSGGKTAILRSNDGGRTFAISDVTTQFRAHGNSNGRGNGERLAVDPNLGSILFCGTENNLGLTNTPCLFKSTNTGATWTAVTSIGTIGESAPNNNGINLVVFDPSTGTKGNATQTIIFGVSQIGTNMYMSTDGGTSFNPIAGAPTAMMPQRAVWASNRILYVTYGNAEGPGNGNAGAIWTYNLANGVWTNITPTGIGYHFCGISVDPKNPNRVIASTTNTYLFQYGSTYGDHYYLTTNGGTSWTDLMSKQITLNPNGCTWMGAGQSLHWGCTIEFNPFNTNQAFVGSGNGLFSCDNLNTLPTTWNFYAFGIEESVPEDFISVPSGPLFSSILDYGGFQHGDVTVYAPQYKPLPNPSATYGLAYAAGNTNYLVRVGQLMYYSTNQGVSWTQTGAISGTNGYVAVNSNASVIVHCPGGSTTSYYSTNNGTSWTTCNGLNFNTVPVADQVNPNIFYAFNKANGNMMVSTDGGANFTLAGSAGSAANTPKMRSTPGFEGDVWVALWNGVGHSINGGKTFTKAAQVTSCESIGLGKAAPAKSYPTVYIWGAVGGVTGLYRSIDQGITWTRINDDAHQFGGPGNGEFVVGDMNIYGRVYMSSVGLGVIYGSLSTSVQPVTVSLTCNPSSICVGSSTTLTANITVNGVSVSKVAFYDGTTLLGTVTQAPYTFTVTNVTNVTHSYIAKVTDNTAAVTASSMVMFTPNTPTPLSSYLQVNAGGWNAVSNATVTAGQSLNIGPQPLTGNWTWTGPNGYTSVNRELDFTAVTSNQNGVFTGTYTDANGCISSITDTIRVQVSQSIPLVQGWNLISTNVLPADSSIATLFNGLNVQEIKTTTAFWEKGQAPAFNGLQTIHSGAGYFVNMNSAGTLQITGFVNQSTLSVTVLKTGWNLIGCPYQSTIAIASLLNTTNSLELKNFDGFWMPNATTNSITTIDPGKGYFIQKK